MATANTNITKTLNKLWDRGGVATLVKTYHSGNSWYRKYSDGFIEQGGRLLSTNKTVTYPLSFQTSYNSVQATISCAVSGATGYVQILEPKTTTFFIRVLTRAGATVDDPADWYACGY